MNIKERISFNERIKNIKENWTEEKDIKDLYYEIEKLHLKPFVLTHNGKRYTVIDRMRTASKTDIGFIVCDGETPTKAVQKAWDCWRIPIQFIEYNKNY